MTNEEVLLLARYNTEGEMEDIEDANAKDLFD